MSKQWEKLTKKNENDHGSNNININNNIIDSRDDNDGDNGVPITKITTMSMVMTMMITIPMTGTIPVNNSLKKTMTMMITIPITGTMPINKIFSRKQWRQTHVKNIHLCELYKYTNDKKLGRGSKQECSYYVSRATSPVENYETCFLFYFVWRRQHCNSNSNNNNDDDKVPNTKITTST